MPYKLSQSKRDDVKSLILNDESTTSIVKRTGVSKSQVNRMKASFNPCYIRQHAGRHRIVKPFTKTVLRLKLLSGSLQSARDAHKYLRGVGYSISYSATRKLIKELGFRCRIKYLTAAIDKTLMKKRYDWPKKHSDWSVEDWKKVIFSDETKLNLWGSDGAEYTYILRGEKLRPFNFKSRKQGGGGSIMIWGCMTALGPGYACRLLEKTMNSSLYQHILQTSYFDTLRYYGLGHTDVVFQQDGAKCHTSDSTINWMNSNGIRYINNWPPCSPDLNPIEHLWHHVKKRLDGYPLKPKNVEELWQRFDYEWNRFTKEDMNKYYTNYHKRIEAVINARGGYTKY